jgi:integrase
MPRSDEPRLRRHQGRDAWYIYDARRRISTGCTDRASAEAVLAAYLKEKDRAQLPIISVAVILDRYLADRRTLAIPGLARLEYAHKPLARILGPKPPEAITGTECRRYTTRRRADDVTDATIRTELQALRAALRWAADPEQRLIAAAPKIEMPAKPEARVRWLTRAEASRLLDACRAHHIRLFITLALHTAARSGAILALTWDRIDLDRRLLDYREPGRARTRKRRVAAPINDTLHAALVEAKNAATTDYVIEWAGGPVLRIAHAFRDTARRAGLIGVTPHVLRHTAVTWMMQAGVDPWQASGLAGMTLEMVQSVYGHHHPDYLKEAARSLG